jgi:hypothetical protein
MLLLTRRWVREGRATTHWAENTGTVPAGWIAVDIPLP